MSKENIENIYELTPLQQGMLFHSLYSPESPVYNNQLDFTLHGNLDQKALERSWNYLVERHSVLRTSFVWERLEKPYQVVHRQTTNNITYHDLSTVSENEREQQLCSFVEDERVRPFALNKAPLLRLALITLDNNLYQLVWTFHHIILEGRSAIILLGELCKIYNDFLINKSPDLPPTRPYIEYVKWHRKQDQAGAEKFWREKFKDFNTVIHLPIDKSPPGEVADVVYVEQFQLELSQGLYQAVQETAQKYRITLNTVIQGLWSILLGFYTAEENVVFGTAISGIPPDLPGEGSSVGLYVNTLPVPVQLNMNEQLAHWLQTLQLDQAEMRQYGYSSLLQVKSWSGVSGGQSLFNTILGFENWSRDLHTGDMLTGLKTFKFNIHKESDQPLTLFVDAGEKLLLTMVYDVERFDRGDIERMLEHCRLLLERMTARPDQLISQLSILSDREQRQQTDWNRTARDYPREKTVADLFEMQAASKPQAIAVEYAGNSLSYQQLNERANRLAHYLNKQGVGPDVMVGLFMDRSVDMIVCLLGILKAGGAYVPLDLDYPQSRLTFMLEDARVPVLLSLSTLTERQPDFDGQVIYLDTDWAAIERESSANPDVCVTADILAYVIYTSGSTGKPKGVEIPHRAINRLVCYTDYYQVNTTDRIAQASNVSFDAATFEIWGALLNGASLVGISKEILLNSKSLAACLNDQGITAMFMTTALFNKIAREVPDAFKGLRGLMFGGEAVDPNAVRQVMANGPPEHLLHVYGPTESTTFASWYEVDDVPAGAKTVPIGRPLANTSLHILDKYMKQVPVGIPGELYIGGDGLARGYLNRVELTAEKFVSDPFSEKPDARLYRTGDKVRYRSDGAIEFVGRYDEQVKLRGFRIELGEIESALAEHEAVRDAAVIVREDGPDDKQLVAYIVEQDGSSSIATLRKHMKTALPEYMVPSAFVVLDELPLTANGKLDRKALPLAESLQMSAAAEYMAPRTLREEQLAKIWSEVLKQDRVGIHDNFFDLGGHSLIATQVVSRVRDELNVELPLADLFESPTVAELAAVIALLGADSASGEAQAIRLMPRDEEVPLSYAQQRLWFIDQLEPGSPAYIIPVAIKLKGSLDARALRMSLQEIVDRHEVLRTSFVMHEGLPKQKITDQQTFELLEEDLSAVSEQAQTDKLKLILREEALRPFNLETGPMMRGHIFRLADDEHVLMLAMHHIVSDGWSIGILFRELGALYTAFCHGRPSPLSALPVQYADFAIWQRQWLTGEVLEAQLNYWKKQLDGVANLELPTDRPRPAIQTFAGAQATLILSQPLTKQLEAINRQQGVTPFMTLLAAFSILLKNYSGQQEVVVGTPIANRNHREIEDLIGFFVNTLVFRTDVSGNPGFRELLGRVKQVAVDAYQHQDLPFETLVDELQLERDRSRNPLFQILFAVQNAPFSTLNLEQLTLEGMPGNVQTTRFDIEVHINQVPQGLIVNMNYNTDLFNADTIERMLGHYRTVLQAIADNTDCRIDDLDLLTDEDYHQQVVEWNRTGLTFPAQANTVLELFEASVERTPEAVALEFADSRLTYRELNRRANRLAHYLRDRGVGPDSLVGICLQRGPGAVQAVLAVLKAGGGYVPLDPAYPQQRLDFMLQDAQLAVLITHSKLVQTLPHSEAAVICLDGDEPWSASSDANPDVQMLADNVAYVIYTSGSTGRPKGIVMTHGVLCNLIQWQMPRSDNSAGGRTLQFSSLSFDVSFQELFATWCAGGTLVLVEEALRRDPVQLLAFLDDARINRVFMPFAALNQLTEVALSTGRLPAQLQEVITAGEALQVTPALEQMFERLDGCTLDNQYGPSETHVVTAWRLQGVPSQWPRLPPIGRPIANATIYLLDERLRPVPIGVPGEMHIGGACLARGYLGRADLTAERFIADPFSNEPGARLYRTGDLARYRADGCIEFIGRADSQVKLRGYRIELGEIEAVLMDHTGVQACVAMLREDHAGDRRLVAYFIGQGVESDQLRAFMQKKLPEYMLPSVFMELESLPLTPSGKVDRRSLPAPAGERQTGVEYMEPRTELERELVNIWKDVLKVDRIGVFDNFFELGGHSLMATQVVSQIRETMQLELAVADLFENPTIAALADFTEITQWAKDSREAEHLDQDEHRQAGEL